MRTTNTPGRYESGWIAYTRLWQEAFSNPRVKEVSICAAAQSGKTESLLNCLRYAIAEDPGPALWIMPAESLARSFSETRLQPSLGDCQPCAEQIPKNRDRFKLLEMHFADMSLNLCGANSPGQLSSRPIRYLFADEIDKFPEAGTKEAGALELAKVRTTTFWNAKLILTSTPTVPGGQIWQAYESREPALLLRQVSPLPAPPAASLRAAEVADDTRDEAGRRVESGRGGKADGIRMHQLRKSNSPGTQGRDDSRREVEGDEPDRSSRPDEFPPERALFTVAKLGEHCPRIP